MFSNAPLATSIDCHQCVWFFRAHSTLLCFEVNDRIIVICSLPSPTMFDLYKCLWAPPPKLVNSLICVQRPNCKPPLPGKKKGTGSKGGCSHECFYAHIVGICTHCTPMLTLRPEWRSFDLREHRVDDSSGAVHRTHSRGEQCCLLASPVSALHSAHLADYPLTQFVFVDVDCWALSAHASVFIYTSGPLLSSLYMQSPICNDIVDVFNVAEQGYDWNLYVFLFFLSSV